ncbi:MAG: DNA polymerase III subunit delta' [Eubacteriales bacterium]|nr:DNA polymerase III subunit delta' [Eubacteriales bacterium]
MRFDEFIARPALISHLRNTFGSGRVYHAYIFAGPEGTGKKTMARICAQALFCTDETQRRPCGKCPGCLQFQEGHPDVHTLAVPEGKSLIPVDSVRELLAALSDLSFSGGMRVVLVDQAELLGLPGQNALLKTLEEPPENTVFLLCVTSANSLLPTILSRCQVVRFSPIDEDLLAQELVRRGAQEEDARWIARYCEGSLGRALQCLQDRRLLDLSKAVRSAYEAAVSGKGTAAASACLKAEKETARETLDCFETIGRSLLREGDEAGARLLQAVFEARRMLRSNVTWQYALENLLMRMHSA